MRTASSRGFGRVTPSSTGASEGTIIASGEGNRTGRHEFQDAQGLALDFDGAVFVADYSKHAVVRWSPGAVEGIIIAGGNGAGAGLHQLQGLWGDQGWPSGPFFYPMSGVALDHDGAVVIADYNNHRVVRWAPRAAEGVVIAGGNGQGAGCHQLRNPSGVALDRHGAVIIADSHNDRVVRWCAGAAEGIVIAGGNGQGAGRHQLFFPQGIALDTDGAVVIADSVNHRVMRWCLGETEGTVIAGGNGEGAERHQLCYPCGVALDHDGAVVIGDYMNNRVVRWAPGAAEGVVIAGGNGPGPGRHQLYVPSDVALTCIRRSRIAWNPRLHRMWPLSSRALVRIMLLIQSSRSHRGFVAVGPLLVSGILPFALPALMLSPTQLRLSFFL